MNDMKEEADKLVEELQPYVDRQQLVRDRIRDGLSKSGKRLRRNANCPCGSGRKFKKCHGSDLRDKVSRSIPRLVTSKFKKQIKHLLKVQQWKLK